MNQPSTLAKRLGLRQPSAAFPRAPRHMAVPAVPANPPSLGLRWQAQRDTAFAHPKTNPYSTARPPESGGKRAALQTLRATCKRSAVAKRLDCGGFSTAFAQPPAVYLPESFHQ